MAFYTVQIRSLYESGFDFGLKNYPIWDESKRDWLNQSIINHYYEYEIGYETPGIFKFKLNVKMSEVMPYLNPIFAKMFDTETDLMGAAERSEERNTTSKTKSQDQGKNTETGNDTKNNKSEAVRSTLPDQIMSWSRIGDNVYATEGNVGRGNESTNYTHTTNNNSNSTGEGSEDSKLTIKGNLQGKYNFEILAQYAELLRPALYMLFGELDELFMCYYGGVTV